MLFVCNNILPAYSSAKIILKSHTSFSTEWSQMHSHVFMNHGVYEWSALVNRIYKYNSFVSFRLSASRKQ